MIIGYARVSTRDQNLQMQIDALQAAGCEKIYEEKVSGAAKIRPKFDEMLENVRKGDTIVVWKLDRLGRSLVQLVNLIGELGERGINFRSLTDREIDTSTSLGRLLFIIASALAEMERDRIRERTRAGLDSARAKGLVGGRKRKIDDKTLASARLLLEAGKPPKEVAGQLKVSVATLYRYIPNAASLRQDQSFLTDLKRIVRKSDVPVPIAAMDVLKPRPQRRKQPT